MKTLHGGGRIPGPLGMELPAFSPLNFSFGRGSSPTSPMLNTSVATLEGPYPTFMLRNGSLTEADRFTSDRTSEEIKPHNLSGRTHTEILFKPITDPYMGCHIPAGLFPCTTEGLKDKHYRLPRGTELREVEIEGSFSKFKYADYRDAVERLAKEHPNSIICLNTHAQNQSTGKPVLRALLMTPPAPDGMLPPLERERATALAFNASSIFIEEKELSPDPNNPARYVAKGRAGGVKMLSWKSSLEGIQQSLRSSKPILITDGANTSVQATYLPEHGVLPLHCRHISTTQTSPARQELYIPSPGAAKTFIVEGDSLRSDSPAIRQLREQYPTSVLLCVHPYTVGTQHIMGVAIPTQGI